ncbi:hypothetical protein [Neorhizobium petrolearium]|uniref:Uncharacterized protein n=1 Tax=Neorhizobium petrolearium TaxID=515361 RepID=A0ABY8M279_9HYPH|nr:hypothetical protein [Neorhizobium petrolearium]MCC2608374.1 hypothetical protein [Neorhizobium petrolearium]WGI68653.1 hypothetical protein QEO92_00700 [Neorhizobium petrolearium]
MGQPVAFQGANMVLRAPKGQEETVQDLHTFTNGLCSVSCWELSAEELAEVTRTGRIFLSVFSGRTQPPVFLGSENTVRDVCADYGVWRR